jgi:hypothetical protein
MLIRKDFLSPLREDTTSLWGAVGSDGIPSLHGVAGKALCCIAPSLSVDRVRMRELWQFRALSDAPEAGMHGSMVAATGVKR